MKKDIWHAIAKLAEVGKTLDTILEKPDPPYIGKVTLECYFCKGMTDVGPVGRVRHWRLDCPHCANRERIVALTNYTREEVGRSSFTEFKLKDAEVFFKMKEEDSTTYAWKFDFINDKTTCKRIEIDVQNPIVATIDSILPITLENMRSKVKLALVFG